jgi:D-3-phosphoglycerate dehydrogenase
VPPAVLDAEHPRIERAGDPAVRVLIADAFEPAGVDRLTAAGCEVFCRPGLKDAALAQAIRDLGVEVLIVRGTAVTASMFDASALSLVVRAGAGYNTIDVAAASSRGIYVSNCPGRNAAAVAELAFGLMLALDRRIPDNVRDLRAGIWNKKEYSKAAGLCGRTLGLLGYGHIGQEMARRAYAFGMPVVVWSRRFAGGGGADAPTVQIAQSPTEVAERCDVLSVHLALAPETRRLVDATVLERLKPGASFINTARGEIVDADALAAVVRERQIRVALDVFASEPTGATGAFNDPIVSLPLVYGTHHIGASTEQAQQAIAEEAVRVVVSYKKTGRVPNVINLAKKTPATHMLVVRHRDRPGVLANVFDRLRDENINVQETENVIFDGAEAAMARISLDAAPSESLLALIRNGDRHIIDVRVVRL